MNWAAEHVVGVAQGVSEDILADLRANFQGECSEVGMYLALVYITTYRTYKFLHSIFLLFKILSGVRDLEI